MKPWFDQQGRLPVNIPLAKELPSVALRESVGGTAYRVTISYDGARALPAKLLKLMERDGDAE